MGLCSFVVSHRSIQDPKLRQVADELAPLRLATALYDENWTLVWVSDELKALIDEEDEGKLGIGRHIVECYMSDTWASTTTLHSQLSSTAKTLPLIASDTPGGTEEILGYLRARFGDLDFDLPVSIPPPIFTTQLDFVQGDLPPWKINGIHVRLHDHSGVYFGNAITWHQALPARLVALVARGDERMYGRMARLIDPGRRASAILFADLESSGTLARSLSSAAYFRLVRAMTTGIDEAVIGNGGIVGKHVGDGVTAFFLAEDCGSASLAARAALSAARAIPEVALAAVEEVGAETGSTFGPEECRINLGVHWGPSLYMGQLVTGGRLEVTALGDEVNECARILESAHTGIALASKVLLEQLSYDDAQALGLDPDSLTYRTISQLPGATEKAVRDAGGLPVTIVSAV